MLRRTLLTIGMLLAPAAAFAQDIILTGTVKSNAQAPIASAFISIPQLSLSQVANASGEYRFVIPASQAGKQVTLEARSIGHTSTNIPVTLRVGTITQNIVMPVSQRSVEQWFNVDAGFEKDPAKQLAQNIQTFPTRFSGIRADGINNFDVSLFKNFRIREGLRAQFRMETFNTLNHVQFAAPDTTPTSTTFGTVTGEKGHGQRQLTLAIKVMF